MHPIQLSERILCPSMFHKSSMMYSSRLPKFISHEVNVCLRNWEWLLFRCIQLFSGHNVVPINKVTRHTPEIFPCFHSVAISFRKVCNSVSSLQRVAPCALQRVTPRVASPRPKWRVLLPRRVSRLSGAVRFDVVRGFL